MLRPAACCCSLLLPNGCTPKTQPALPRTHDHPLWQAWDLTLEMALLQLLAMIAAKRDAPSYELQHSTLP